MVQCPVSSVHQSIDQSRSWPISFTTHLRLSCLFPLKSLHQNVIEHRNIALKMALEPYLQENINNPKAHIFYSLWFCQWHTAQQCHQSSVQCEMLFITYLLLFTIFPICHWFTHFLISIHIAQYSLWHANFLC